ncbi:MAG: hypothetical protein IPL78_27755 [Chloroflexi bacterium]|nr:hypothetical protein [Chloroflexota bacterium]
MSILLHQGQVVEMRTGEVKPWWRPLYPLPERPGGQGVFTLSPSTGTWPAATVAGWK